MVEPMPSFIQGLRGTARGLRGDGHPRHDPPDAPPPRAPKPKAPTRALTFKTGSEEMPHLVHLDHHGLARFRLGTVLVNITADPPQDRLRGRPEQTGNGADGQRSGTTVHDHRD